ncbi:MAG: HD domain-containing protein [Chitinophagales bacterium]
MKRYKEIEKHVLGKLEAELPDDLYYHGLHHTKDVLRSAEIIGRDENITEDEMILLKTAVLFHDSGFTKVYRNHEEIGCDMARKELPRFGFTTEDIEKVCGMIMATKIPQRPNNKLENIIADADLEYLGTEEFWRIGNTLYQEIKKYLNVESERQWNIIQMNFLKSHSYHTDFCRRNREALKQQHLAEVTALVEKES